MTLTERQRELIKTCVETEIENININDTKLSLEVSEDADDKYEAIADLQDELRAIVKLMTID